MRDIPEDLAAHLAGEVTTMCRCWRVTRRDGVVLGFTDHDRDIALDGLTFTAESGLDASEATANAGFAVGGGEVAGALGSAGLTEADLASGLWDDAGVEVFAVNWAQPGQRLRLGVHTIGEVKRTGASFSAELRSLAHRLDARRGRLYAAGCDAELGDARCGVDLDGHAWRGTGAVLAADGRFAFSAIGLEAFAAGWFTGGTVRWLTGANAGHMDELREHDGAAGFARLATWQGAPRPIAAGDTFVVTAGCNKRAATCRTRFANIANFRGFPHMPGTDRALAYPSQGNGEQDGGSLFR